MADGSYRRRLSRGEPRRDETADAAAWIDASVDVEEMNRMLERQQVLIAELQHRTRNLIGVARALAERTIAGSADLAEFRIRYLPRLDALARAQGLLSQFGDGEEIAFGDLIRGELAIVGDGLGRVALDGPDEVALRSGSVQILALALHELVTNAIKHGAFAHPQGRLEVRWRVERRDDDARPWLRVDWRERGVTIAAAAARTRGDGSGRELIERALPHQLGAETRYALENDGVHCVVALPVSG